MRTCVECGREFISFVSAQTRCPTCADIKYLNPSIVLRHEPVAEWTVLLGFQPTWKRAGQVTGWVFTETGKQFGAAWEGRMDLHAPMIAWKRDATVLLRHVVATHLVRYRAEMRKRNDWESGTVVEYTKYHKVPIAQGVARETLREWAEAAAADEGFRVTLDDESVVQVERRPYFVLWPATQTPELAFVRVAEGYKYTLKGLGAEWSIRTHWPNEMTKLASVSGGFRSGRNRWQATYALVPVASVITQTKQHTTGSGKQFVATRRVWPDETRWTIDQ